TSAWTSSRRRCLLQVYRSRGPTQTSPGKNTGCPAAPAPITAPASVGFWASRLETRSPGRSGLHRGSLAFGAAVRLGLLLHPASRRQLWRLTTQSLRAVASSSRLLPTRPAKDFHLQSSAHARHTSAA